MMRFGILDDDEGSILMMIMRLRNVHSKSTLRASADCDIPT